MLVMLAGTMPRNLFFLANLRVFNAVPWAVVPTAACLWLFWKALRGDFETGAAAERRRQQLRAHRVPARLWFWSLLAGALGIVALVLGLKLANRLVALPTQALPDLAHVPRLTVAGLLLLAAPVAGIVEEAAFRGVMQGPIERRWGWIVAILITGTMFAIAHLDFTPALWPYYVAVAAIYGGVTSLTNSILPAIALHTAGNLYSNFDLLWHGSAEWQAPATGPSLIWETGVDRAFVLSLAGFATVAALTVLAFARLAKGKRSPSG